jgi:hypothetical protein
MYMNVHVFLVTLMLKLLDLKDGKIANTETRINIDRFLEGTQVLTKLIIN